MTLLLLSVALRFDETALAVSRLAEGLRDPLREAKKALGLLNHYVGSDGFVVGGKLSLGDCTLVPMLFFIVTLGAPMGLGATPLADYPNLAASWAHAGKDAILSKVNAEMGAALAKMQGG